MKKAVITFKYHYYPLTGEIIRGEDVHILTLDRPLESIVKILDLKERDGCYIDEMKINFCNER